MRMEVQVLKDALQRMQSEMVNMRQGIGFAVPMVKLVVEETADLGHFDKEIAMENVENVPDIKEVVVPAAAQAALMEAKRQAYCDGKRNAKTFAWMKLARFGAKQASMQRAKSRRGLP